MFDTRSVDIVESDELPASAELATQKRPKLVEQLAEIDDEIADSFLNDSLPRQSNSLPRSGGRPSLKFSPVFFGSAIKDTAAQPLLDGVCAYLASPSERQVVARYRTAIGFTAGRTSSGIGNSLVALPFKVEEGRFGPLTHMRVYRGNLKESQFIFRHDGRSGKRVMVHKSVQMHSDEMEVRPCECGREPVLRTWLVLRIFMKLVPARFPPSLVSSARPVTRLQTAPQIIQWFVDYPILMRILHEPSQTSIFVPDLVISLAIKHVGNELPTFLVH